MPTQKSKLGRVGEKMAVEFLRHQGYRIVECNFQNRLGEIDIIAYDGEVLCFVEVRTRTSDWHGHPFESITARKRSKIIRTAQSYLKLYKLDDVDARFDVVGVLFEKLEGEQIEIIKNAFDAF